jgi:hypothetical protein
MTSNLHRRSWLLLAAFAIGIALVFLLIPQAHAGNGADCLAILPLLFAGLISPLCLRPRVAFLYLGRTPDAPALSASFQRPPPFAFA